MGKAFIKEQKIDYCENCELLSKCNPQMRKVFGKGKKKILFIVDSPSRADEDFEKPLSGYTGRILKKVLNEQGIDLYKDCWITYAMKSRMPKGNSPTNKQLKCCKQHLKDEITELKPEKIIPLGKVALNALIGHKESVTSINKWIGFQIPDQEFKAWVFPLYNPKHLIANQKDVVLFFHFNKYLNQAIKWEMPFVRDSPNINYNPTEKEIITFLEKIINNPTEVVTDIETTGLNPREKLPHEILCVSVAANVDGEDKCLAFIPTKQMIVLLEKIFTSPDIKLIAHNLAFEDLWFRLKWNILVSNWYADTMLISHIVDNRQYICGLKFQVGVQFGSFGYEKEAHKYMKVDPETGLNTLKDMDPSELRKYCALDSWYELRLYRKQMKNFRYKKAFLFFTEGLHSLIDIQNNGINVDRKYLESVDVQLTKKLEDAKCAIMTSKEAIAWKNASDKPLNINSAMQLKKLFYKILDYPILKKTKKGNPSVDAEVLGKLKKKFCKNILVYRKIYKIKNTYLSNYLGNIQPDGLMHPSFPLHIPRTYRGSSKGPNLQNVPKHDKEANKLLRGGIIPKPGRFLFEPDFKQLEVRISCCYHKDPVLMDYIVNNYDFHKEYGRKIFFLKDNSNDDEFMALHELRYMTKNKFVFAEFYGDYFVRCATNIWEELNKDVRAHLRTKGIKSYRNFEAHLQDIENYMWNKKFKVYSKWRKDIWNFYLQNGFIRTYTGFTFSGPMKRNDVTNYPIQGTAFHCLLWCLVNINYELKKRGMRTHSIAEIHDAILFDVVPEEFTMLKKICRYVMCEKIREYWTWINVPLDIDGEMSAIDGKWSEMTKVKGL